MNENERKTITELWSENSFTVPNLLTMLRIVLIAPLMIFFFAENYSAVFALLFVSGITDVLDGFAARTLNQVSELGKCLDPLADKLTLFAVGVCIVTLFPYLFPLVAVFILKEVLMIAGAAVLLKKSIKPPAAKWYGKAATFSFYASSLLAVILYLSDVKMQLLVTVMFFVTFVLMLISVIGYYRIFKSLLNYT